jgi:phasin family protein
MPTKKTTTKTPAARKKSTAPTAMPAAMEPVEDAAAANKETVEAAMKMGSQAATKSYEQAVAMAQEQLEKASSSVFRRYEDAATMSQENVDACVQSTTVFAKAVEAMSKELMSFAQGAVEANVANAKALFGAKTMQELIDLQTDFSRSGFDSLVAESAKLTDLSMTLANDAVEPIQLRLNATVEKLMKPIAA